MVSDSHAVCCVVPQNYEKLMFYRHDDPGALSLLYSLSLFVTIAFGLIVVVGVVVGVAEVRSREHCNVDPGHVPAAPHMTHTRDGVALDSQTITRHTVGVWHRMQ